MLLLALLPIGDTICMVPTVRALRARAPGALITALAFPGAAPLLRCVPEIDQVLPLRLTTDPGAVDGPRRVLQIVRARQYDVAIDFTSPVFKWIGLLAGIPARTVMKFDRLWWVIPHDHAAWRATHLTELYYHCADELDLPPWPEVDHVPRLVLPASARLAAATFLSEQRSPAGNGPLVGIHAGGTWLGGLKRWPLERFVTLIDYLQSRLQAHILLLGGPEDAALSARLGARTRRPVVSAAGALSLPASLALIERCDLFIGNDSALLHAAAALGTPYLGLFGPTWPANFRPIARDPQQGSIVLPDPPCRRPHFAVGGDVVWRRPCCKGTCAALATLDAGVVYVEAERMLALHTGALREAQS
jgi:ADP-heptose:LPS heptosyltransferase